MDENAAALLDSESSGFWFHVSSVVSLSQTPQGPLTDELFGL